MKAYKGGKSSDDDSGSDQNPLRISRMGGEGGTDNKGLAERYAAALLDLVKPYHADIPDFDEMEALLNLAVIAWNLSNMKNAMPAEFKTMWAEAKADFGTDNDSVRLLEKMLKEKPKRYGGDDLFITKIDIDLTEGNELLVAVTAKPMDEFLASDFTDEGDYGEGLNDQPGYVNRNAVTVTAKQPFLDWLANTGDEPLEAGDGVESTVYLMAETQTDEETEDWLKKNFDRVFRNELEAWWADENDWPPQRTYQLFREWFDVSYQSAVYDLEDYPVDKDDE